MRSAAAPASLNESALEAQVWKPRHRASSQKPKVKNKVKETNVKADIEVITAPIRPSKARPKQCARQDQQNQILCTDTLEASIARLALGTVQDTNLHRTNAARISDCGNRKAAGGSVRTEGDGCASVEPDAEAEFESSFTDPPDDEPVGLEDELAVLMAESRKKRMAKEAELEVMRARVSAEMEAAMDVGVRANPLLAKAFGIELASHLQQEPQEPASSAASRMAAEATPVAEEVTAEVAEQPRVAVCWWRDEWGHTANDDEDTESDECESNDSGRGKYACEEDHTDEEAESSPQVEHDNGVVYNFRAEKIDNCLI